MKLIPELSHLKKQLVFATIFTLLFRYDFHLEIFQYSIFAFIGKKSLSN